MKIDYEDYKNNDTTAGKLLPGDVFRYYICGNLQSSVCEVVDADTKGPADKDSINVVILGSTGARLDHISKACRVRHYPDATLTLEPPTEQDRTRCVNPD